MDRQSMIGLFLIGLVLIGYSIFTAPSQEELDAIQRRRDSVERVEASALKAKQQALASRAPVQSAVDTAVVDDSTRTARMNDLLGPFASASKGEDKIIVLENEDMKVSVSSLGGRIREVELKKYKTSAGKRVTLFSGDSTRFELNFFARNRIINTGELYYASTGQDLKVSAGDSATLSMRLYAGDTTKYIEYVYTISGQGYKLGFDVRFVGVQDIIASNTQYVELGWSQHLQPQEGDIVTERNNSTVYYMFADDDAEVESLSETSDDQDEIKTRLKWVSMKQQFFTQVLVAEDAFDKPTRISTVSGLETDTFVKAMKASFTLPYRHAPTEEVAMHFYLGPNHYQYLRAAGDHLEKQIPLGWGIFGWVNRFIVIPIFNFLNSFNWNYGLIILVLTLVIKLMLSPFTFKAYLSQAKMKVLRPEVEEIQGKHKEDPMKMQQEMMGLYRKAGVSPLGGCLPMLLQLPILIAMFRFFPQSIELRQESFLWAKDLSTYDSILDLPFHIWGYGDHVSLFTLLMTVSTLLITMVNSQSTMTNPQMKWMMYLMPIIFLGVFNNYSAGLSYYYFLANTISIGQQYLFRAFVDEDEIHRKIQENKKRPASQTKSKFQQRLEKMAKDRGYNMPK
ncbi:MAG: membrane protein insertase YidC [Bacteroidota bacterium]